MPTPTTTQDNLLNLEQVVIAQGLRYRGPDGESRFLTAYWRSATMALTIFVLTRFPQSAFESKPGEVAFLDQLVLANQAGLARALERKDSVPIDEFKKLQIPVYGENLLPHAHSENFINLSTSQYRICEQLKVNDPEKFKRLKIAWVPPFHDFELLSRNSGVADCEINPALYNKLAPAELRGYYELTLGEIPGGRRKGLEEQIDFLREQNLFITSAAAAWIIDASIRKTAVKDFYSDGEQSCFSDLVRVASVPYSGLVLGRGDHSLTMLELDPDSKDSQIGIAGSIE